MEKSTIIIIALCYLFSVLFTRSYMTWSMKTRKWWYAPASWVVPVLNLYLVLVMEFRFNKRLVKLNNWWATGSFVVMILFLLPSCNIKVVDDSKICTKSYWEKEVIYKPKKHCLNNLPEGIVVDIPHLHNTSELIIRLFNSTEKMVIKIDDEDRNLRLNVFGEGDTIIHCK